MEKIRTIWVGKNKFKALDNLEKDYEDKIGRIIPFKIHLIQKTTKNYTEDKLLKEEGKNILKAVSKDDFLILLDEKGKEFDSFDFSKFLNEKINLSKRISFVVGSFSGVSDEIKQRANFKLSLSRMTFSNYIARIVLLEQIYRAMTLIKGIEYHR